MNRIQWRRKQQAKRQAAKNRKRNEAQRQAWQELRWARQLNSAREIGTAVHSALAAEYSSHSNVTVDDILRVAMLVHGGQTSLTSVGAACADVVDWKADHPDRC